MNHAVSIRTDLRPGDVGAIVRLHGLTYAHEYGFDVTFEAYVAGPLAAFALHPKSRERIWLAEEEGALVGCIAIVEASHDVAQLRWFLVARDARGKGLGQRLLQVALAFAKNQGYASVLLWTVAALSDAARLYVRAGFRKTETRPARLWGVEVVEEKYELRLP